MNAQRSFEIKASIAGMTALAAIASGLLTVSSANAAPGEKKTTAKVTRAVKKKPVVVKMSGSRRAGEIRAKQLFAEAVAAKEARDNPPVQEIGTPDVQPGTVSTVASNSAQPVTNQPVTNAPIGANAPNAIPLGPGVGNIPGVVFGNGFGNGYGIIGPPMMNTGNGFAPVIINGFGNTGAVIAPIPGGGFPTGGVFNPFGGGFFGGYGF